MGILNIQRLLSLTLAFFILAAHPASLFTAPLTPAPASITPAFPQPPLSDKVGVAAALKGIVKMQRQSRVGEAIENGEPIYLGDIISTDEKGALQILLLDETVFTIGPNSAIMIDKFVYDPKTEQGQINAKVVKGVFRFVTGKIARKKPSDMKVELPSGSIGVRGTIVTGETNGTKSTVVLLGPGSKHNTNHRIGQITVGNSDKEVTVTRPGFGSVIDGPGGVPSAPFQIPAEDLARMAASLEPPEAAKADEEENKDGGDGGGSEGGDPTEQAGQDTAAAGDSVEIAAEAGGIAKSLEAETITAVQKSSDTIFKIEDGLAKLRDLRTVPTGQFNFRVDNAPLSSGSFTLKFDIDFGNRTVGGGHSHFTYGGPGAGDSAVSSRSFASGDGDASFRYDFLFSTKAAVLVVDFFNSGGQTASSATAYVTANDGTVTGEASLVKGNGLSEI